MGEKSFYDLSYIIEINEQRIKEIDSSYQKVVDRITNIILIYSAIAIYLTTIIRDIFMTPGVNVFFLICFTLFTLLFLTSVGFTVALLVPVKLARLKSPKEYYDNIRVRYEQDEDIKKAYQDKDIRQKEIVKLINSSYILELGKTIDRNERVLVKKSYFYHIALVLGLLSAVPYIVCIGFHLSKKDDKIQKAEIVKPRISGTLQQIDYMSKITKSQSEIVTDSSVNNGTNTKPAPQLPGVDNSRIIDSSPNIIKDNSPKIISKGN